MNHVDSTEEHMEIGPIPGIRAVLPVQTSRPASDLSAVFRVEFQREQQERYTPHERNAERGLEDEDDESGPGEMFEAEPIRTGNSDEGGDRQISFFA